MPAIPVLKVITLRVKIDVTPQNDSGLIKDRKKII